jgi:hypothetical protein
LPDGGAGLKVREIGGALAEREFADTCSDRAGRDEHDFTARGAHAVQLISERLNAVPVQVAGGVGEDVRPDLNDDSFGPRNDFAANGIGHVRVVSALAGCVW